MDALVQLESVAKRYEDRAAPAVAEVSVAVAAGEAVAIMGSAGSGTSTLLSLVAGMDRPTTGTVRVGDQHMHALSETGAARFRPRHVGMIFQFFNLLDDMTVMDDVLLPAQLADVRSGAVRARDEKLLVTLRNGHPRDAYPAWLTMRAAARGGDADKQIGPALDRTGLTQRADDNVSASQPLRRAQ